MLALILIILAAIFKAIADTLAHHFDTSVFRRLPKQFWNPAESYKYIKFIPLTRFRPDAWHLANSGMIVCFITSIFTYKSIWINIPEWGWVLIFGTCFNLVFELFYSKWLRK